jgi:hypothetical protein
MVPSNWPGGYTMDKLVGSLATRWPAVNFAQGEEFHWSPSRKTVFYAAEDSLEGCWALLHETGHALLGHAAYKLDFELLELELAAWQHAVKLAKPLGLVIPDDHIQDCLDTYRAWLYRRSICPHCEAITLQHDAGHHYACHNCGSSWRVSPSRFCRPYRSTAPTPVA